MQAVCAYAWSNRLAKASDPWLKHFWANSAFRPPTSRPPSPSTAAAVQYRATGPDGGASSTETTPGSRCCSSVHDELHELERFASSFKARRIRLGFTQTNVGQFHCCARAEISDALVRLIAVSVVISKFVHFTVLYRWSAILPICRGQIGS